VLPGQAGAVVMVVAIRAGAHARERSQFFVSGRAVSTTPEAA